MFFYTNACIFQVHYIKKLTNLEIRIHTIWYICNRSNEKGYGVGQNLRGSSSVAPFGNFNACMLIIVIIILLLLLLLLLVVVVVVITVVVLIDN